MDPKIWDILREDPRYAYEAYEFVCEAVSFTQEQLGRLPGEDDDPADDHHVSGAELARGACELAVREFGMMAPVVFRLWGVRTTDDFGELVFKLIKVDRLSKSCTSTRLDRSSASNCRTTSASPHSASAVASVRVSSFKSTGLVMQ